VIRWVPEQQPRIVLYEDDQALADEIVSAFAEEGYHVAQAGTGNDVLEAAYAQDPCVLIMDRMIHANDSLAIVSTIRASGNRTPVMVISSLNSVDNRIHGLREGGDDYLVKPFSMDELIARVEALMRRTPDIKDAREARLVVGDLVMELIDRTVYRGSRVVTLSPREFSLLEYLMRHSGQIVSRSMVLEGVWKYRAPLVTNVVDVHMSALRRKVDAEGEKQLIKSRRGIGFIITESCE
jgi:two-component system OmpR family response regulator